MKETWSLGDTVDCCHKNLNDQRLAPITYDSRIEDGH